MIICSVLVYFKSVAYILVMNNDKELWCKWCLYWPNAKKKKSNKRKTFTYSAEHRDLNLWGKNPSSFWATFSKFHLNKMLLILLVWVWSSHSWYNLHSSLGVALSLPGQRAYVSHVQCLYNYRLHVITQHTHVYLRNTKIIILTCGESQHISAVCFMADTEAD